MPKRFFPLVGTSGTENPRQTSSIPPSRGVGRGFYGSRAGPSRWKAAMSITTTESTSRAFATHAKRCFRSGCSVHYACHPRFSFLRFQRFSVSATDSTSSCVKDKSLHPLTWMMKPSLATADSKYRPSFKLTETNWQPGLTSSSSSSRLALSSGIGTNRFIAQLQSTWCQNASEHFPHQYAYHIERNLDTFSTRSQTRRSHFAS